MRSEKDARHHDFEQKFEAHRVSTTETINSHTENITYLHSHKLNLESTILGQENTIHQKRDVEDHHDASK